MRHSKDITGLPILGIQEGRRCGLVKGFLINAAEGKTEYFLIDNGAWHLGAAVLPYREVYALGAGAVTPLTADSIRPIQDLPEAMALAAQDVALLGAQVYTDTGCYAGILTEFSLSPQDGGITGCFVESSQGTFLVSSANIRTIGKDLVIIRELEYPSEPLEDHALDLPEELTDFGEEDEWSDPAQKAAGDLDAAYTVQEASILLDAAVEEAEVYEEIVGQTTDADSAQEHFEADSSEDDRAEASPEDSAAALFEQRQRRFLVGRRASKSVLDDEGRLLVKVNQEITDEVFDQLKAHGRLIELTMNSKA